MRRRPILLTAGLLYLLYVNASVGIWATISPRSFYDDFPGGGRNWVAVDGPYNEHLVRDVGGGNLALAQVVAQGPHLLYHLVHVALLPTPLDQAAQTVALAVGVIVPLLLLWAAGRGESAPRTTVEVGAR